VLGRWSVQTWALTRSTTFLPDNAIEGVEAVGIGRRRGQYRPALSASSSWTAPRTPLKLRSVE
jgi:hypothetical protein